MMAWYRRRIKEERIWPTGGTIIHAAEERILRDISRKVEG